MFLPFNSVSEWYSVKRERIIPFTTTGAVAYGTNIDGQYAVGIFTTTGGTITAKDNTTLNIICVGGGGGGQVLVKPQTCMRPDMVVVVEGL